MTRAPTDIVRLLVTDIDGTLVDPDKQLTPRTIAAAHRLRNAGIALALISARPPRGLDMLIETLGIDTPRAGFNGGEILGPDHGVLDQRLIDEKTARAVLTALSDRYIDTWVFADGRWFLTDLDAHHVPLERKAVRFEPTLVTDFDGVIGRAGKIMGSSTDHALLARVEHEIANAFAGRVSAHRSQNYYLDITHPDARKDGGLRRLAALLDVPVEQTAAIGDMGNDVPMLDIAGLSIAMGQAAEAVRSRAMFTTGSNADDGWATAMDRFVLPRAPRNH